MRIGNNNKHYKKCEYADSLKRDTIFVPWKIYSEWLMTMQLLPSKEWIATGIVSEQTEDESKFSRVESSQLKNVGNLASASTEDYDNSNLIVHSHHSMGTFHSSVDDEYCIPNYEYSIVVSFSGILCKKRKQLPCGGFGQVDVNVQVEEIEDISLKVTKLLKEQEEKQKQLNHPSYLVGDYYQRLTCDNNLEEPTMQDSYIDNRIREMLSQKSYKEISKMAKEYGIKGEDIKQMVINRIIELSPSAVLEEVISNEKREG